MKKLLQSFLFFVALGLSSISQSEQELPRVLLNTNLGDIVIELYPQAAPISVDNFIKYVNDYYYDGIIFHRVISGFMIQAGGFGFDLSIKQADRLPIVNESDNGLKNRRGSIAMARTADPDSATSQFFINHRSNGRLNYKKNRPGYAVFGQVVEGMDTVDRIAAVETTTQGYLTDVPVEPVQILKARLLNPQSWSALPEISQELDFEAPIPVR
mgnify:CR=1 FL=1